jgi:hypothetical protein
MGYKRSSAPSAGSYAKYQPKRSILTERLRGGLSGYVYAERVIPLKAGTTRTSEIKER